MAEDPTADPRDDRELIAAHVAGDAEAFGELVRRHRDRLWAVALRTSGDREEAADALQDAFVSAYRGAASFRGDSAVTTWLHRVVVNACLDRMRRRKARPSVPLPDDDDGEHGHREVADPRDDLDRLELRMEIDRALAALPVDQRAAVVLVDVEGLPVAEAAEVLGVPEGTVKSRCSRGRARLAVALAGVRNPEADPGVPPPSGPRPDRTVPNPAPRPAPHPGVARRHRRGGDPVTESLPGSPSPDPSDTPGPEATPEQEAFVRGLLGSLPDDDPGMPDDVVVRIGSALALEQSRGAVAAATGSLGLAAPTDDETGGPGGPGLAPVTVLPERRGTSGGPGRTFRWVAGAAAALVVLVGGATVVRSLGGTSSDTSATTAGAAGDSGATKLTATGTAYQRDQLAAQVTALVAAVRDGRAATRPEMAPGSSGATPLASPPPQTSGSFSGLLTAGTLPGCLEQLTGRTGVVPVAVDRGTYEGRAADVVVLTSETDTTVYEVWVVGPLCTRDSADLLEWQSVPAS